jgi:hypothetical protein
MGKITRAQWKEFVNRRLILKPYPLVINLLRFRRRTSIPITWRQANTLVKFKMEEETISANKPNLVEGVEE